MVDQYFSLEHAGPKRTRFSEFGVSPRPNPEQWTALYRGLPVKLTEPVRFERVIRGGGRPERLKDRLNSEYLVVSQKLHGILSEAVPDAQSFEVHVYYRDREESQDYFLLNLLGRLDCLDMARSRYQYAIPGTEPGDKGRNLYCGNRLWRWFYRLRYGSLMNHSDCIQFLYEPVLRRDAIPSNTNVFRALGAIDMVFVSGRVREQLIQTRCTGVDFKVVQTS